MKSIIRGAFLILVFGVAVAGQGAETLVPAAQEATQTGEDMQRESADGAEPATESGAAGEEAPADGIADENVIDRVKITTAGDPNALVCRHERPLGSHIPRRVCRTAMQIDGDRVVGQRKVRNPRARFERSGSKLYDRLNKK